MGDVSEKVLEVSRRAMHKHAKRIYNVHCSCVHCSKPCVVNDRVVRQICRSCGKGFSVEEAKAKYERGEIDYTGSNGYTSNFESPAFKITDPQGREYVKLRDEYEIRAELFQKGITRQNVGVANFNKTLKKELKQNKCYRGPEKTGV